MFLEIRFKLFKFGNRTFAYPYTFPHKVQVVFICDTHIIRDWSNVKSMLSTKNYFPFYNTPTHKQHRQEEKILTRM